jgi:hypothetical protein
MTTAALPGNGRLPHNIQRAEWALRSVSNSCHSASAGMLSVEPRMAVAMLYVATRLPVNGS